MKYLVMLIALLATAGARAQQPSEDDVGAVSAIFQCIAEGLPSDWARAQVIVTLPESGASTGNVRYLVTPEGAPEKIDAFAPCDPAVPARILIKLRESLPAERQAWTGAQVEFVRAGSSFRITYDYPK